MLLHRREVASRRDGRSSARAAPARIRSSRSGTPISASARVSSARVAPARTTGARGKVAQAAAVMAGLLARSRRGRNALSCERSASFPRGRLPPFQARHRPPAQISGWRRGRSASSTLNVAATTKTMAYPLGSVSDGAASWRSRRPAATAIVASVAGQRVRRGSVARGRFARIAATSAISAAPAAAVAIVPAAPDSAGPPNASGASVK